MEQIMLKNVWEIENNPIFSSGGSIGDEKMASKAFKATVQSFASQKAVGGTTSTEQRIIETEKSQDRYLMEDGTESEFYIDDQDGSEDDSLGQEQRNFIKTH